MADRAVNGVELLIHFGTTGALNWLPAESEPRTYDRVVFVCEDGQLHYNNMRRFGGVWLARNGAERDGVTGPLGPDAAAVGHGELADALAVRRGAIKTALMDQRLIAGIGNLMADEILWRARVRPARAVQTLSTNRVEGIYASLQAVVSESTRYGRVPHGRRWLMRVRDDRDAGCPRCGAHLRRSRIGGRTACWCPRCQR